MSKPLKKIDEWCRVTQSEGHGNNETLEVREYHFDPETSQVIEVVIEERENRTNPSKNRQKELSRRLLQINEIPDEVRQKIQELGIEIK